jgi:tRNA 2-thiouridine synthesizing protein A
MDVLVVDARYQSCPGPLLKLIEAVKDAKEGSIVKILATDPAAPEDIRNWAESVGYKFMDYKVINDTYEIYVEVR